MQTEYPNLLALHLKRQVFDVPRGAMRRPDGRIIVFGNDGYDQDERARREVEAVRAYCDDHDIRVEGFGKDPEEGYTWAMVLDLVSQREDDGDGPEGEPEEEFEVALWNFIKVVERDRSHMLDIAPPEIERLLWRVWSGS